MRNGIVLIATALVLLTGQGAMAEFPLVGAGAFSCGKVLEGLEAGYDGPNSWRQGYLSGLNFNFHGPAMADLGDYEGQERWIRNYCGAHPLDDYFVAVIKLWNELRRRQGLEPDTRTAGAGTE